MAAPIAHVKYKNGKRKVQFLKNHCRETGELCGGFLKTAGLYNTGYVAGLIHDMGKASKEFQKRSGKTENKINHTSAGVKFIQEELGKDAEETYELLARDVISYAAGAHHSPFDCVTPYRRDGFAAKIARTPEGYEDVLTDFYDFCFVKRSLEYYYGLAENEFKQVHNRISSMPSSPKERIRQQETSYYYGLLSRTVLSALSDADRINTHCFSDDVRYSEPVKNWKEIERKINSSLDPPNTEGGKLERKIITSAHDEGKSLFFLSVPEKCRRMQKNVLFAIKRAERKDCRHLIYAAGTISGAVAAYGYLRELCGESVYLDLKDEIPGNYEDESWDSLVTVTSIQRLIAIFVSGDLQNVRKFHSLMDSVLVLDSPEYIPAEYEEITRLTLLFLGEICKASVLLSSGVPSYGSKVCEDAENIIPADAAVWEKYRRPQEKEEETASAETGGSQTVFLCSDQRELGGICQEADKNTYALSSLMCQSHRDSVKNRIASAKGTDFYIASDLLPSKKDYKKYRFVRKTDGFEYAIDFSEDILPKIDLKSLDTEQCAEEEVRILLKKDPARYGFYENSEEALMKRARISNGKSAGKPPDPGLEKDLSEIPLFELLTLSRPLPLYSQKGDSESEHVLTQAFNSADVLQNLKHPQQKDERYDKTVIVSFGEGKDIIKECEAGTLTGDAKSVMKRAAGCTVGLPEDLFKDMLKSGKVLEAVPGAYYLKAELYDENIGVTI